MTVNPRPPALVAGGSLLAMAILAGYGIFGLLEPLLDRQDAAITGARMTAAPAQVQAAVWMLYGVAALDVAVAWGLWRLFRPTLPRLAATAAGVRLVYALLFATVLTNLSEAHGLYRAGAPHSFDQAHGLLLAYFQRWTMVLMVFGLHLVLTALLVLRSPLAARALARPLGLLIGLAGLGYELDGIAQMACPGCSVKVSEYTFVGEIALMAWLLWLGATTRRIIK